MMSFSGVGDLPLITNVSGVKSFRRSTTTFFSQINLITYSVFFLLDDHVSLKLRHDDDMDIIL